jgi:glutathione S-transferase
MQSSCNFLDFYVPTILVFAEFPYGKIPLLEFEGKKLSQSFAIARFLGKKYNLAGADDFESAKCDEYADVVKDILKGKLHHGFKQ